MNAAPIFQPGKLYRRSALRGFVEEGMILESDGIRALGYYRIKGAGGRFGSIHVRWIGIRSGGKMLNFHYPSKEAVIGAADWVRKEAKLP